MLVTAKISEPRGRNDADQRLPRTRRGEVDQGDVRSERKSIQATCSVTGR
ncbi:MAG: hypothetical protein ACOC45_02545 [Alkalispirochaetaceae bacterium]